MHYSSDDLTLLKECISGNKDAWDYFVERYSRLVYYAIHKILKSYSANIEQDETEDIFNSVFLSLIENNKRKLSQFKGKEGCSLSSWIRIISINHTINYIKRRKHHVSLNDDSNDSRPLVETIQSNRISAHDQLESAETERAFKTAVNELSGPDRVFMRLYYNKGLPPDEIAGIMNVTVNTIYSKKNRIREKLEKILNVKGPTARRPE